MTAEKTVKLIRVNAGLYRTEGGAAVMHIPGDRLPWLVKFTNGFNERLSREFATLRDAREFLNGR